MHWELLGQHVGTHVVGIKVHHLQSAKLLLLMGMMEPQVYVSGPGIEVPVVHQCDCGKVVLPDLCGPKHSDTHVLHDA